ncbi:NLI interacting factor-like phosphatase-domain-containing protein [Calycina marina]|uniref:NLI interacting factor-like phosphatase-domain-containing protein n=1 Tax=Calycina marina TaxID=1763456 RepID=A0A9P8CII0_9HELO|nr:NLI interacting factor-like phosphatase-domain-containing protein [Calycina marina]
MNSLNILSARVSPPPSPLPSRTNSFGNVLEPSAGKASRRGSRGDVSYNEKLDGSADSPNADSGLEEFANEETPLLDKEAGPDTRPHSIISAFSNGLVESIRWVFSAITAPGVYLIAYLYDESGKFAPFSQMTRLFGGSAAKASTTQAQGIISVTSNGDIDKHYKNSVTRRSGLGKDVKFYSQSSSSGLSSESESEKDRSMSEGEVSTTSNHHVRSKSDEISPARRSIRIKLHNDDTLRQRRHRKAQSTSSQGAVSEAESGANITASTLKSPTSPATSLSMTKYPKAPAPPRPLIPRRQPSYVALEKPITTQKTLILDLDETLIHSMAQGGRMGTGHMVEIKLPPHSAAPGQAPIPQHPVLYYVYKRPYCDEFLRRVCKWYNLVIFTASVQEYADPVIDWLEQERKYFSGRYYRQHCTYRAGAFIKDLTSVEPDLSKVMILDNSPVSYGFHQDNAIPIEGWINDPTDNDLLHLVPMLEGLQYVTDVRAFLALRGGEDGRHMPL